MVKVLHEVERRSGLFAQGSRRRLPRTSPNPRLVTLLAKQLKVPAKAHFHRSQPPAGIWALRPAALLCMLRCNMPRNSRAAQRKPIFLGVSGAGLLFGGGWMVPAHG